MAIQPVDLQLAYLAAPASAAAVNAAQEAPAAAQQAAQAAFVAELSHREESIDETQRAEGTKIRPDPEGSNDPGTYSPRKRRRSLQAQIDREAGSPPSTDGEKHFIDTTA